MIRILDSGFYTTVQDSGRFGFREYGVPVSGAMDEYSSRFANLLLGNDANMATLEFTMTGPKLQFMFPANIAISGANIQPKVNDIEKELNKVISLNANDVLYFGRLKEGMRAYIAIEGGFNTKEVLGSRSMFEGITENSKLNTGDMLYFNLHSKNLINSNVSVKYDWANISSKELCVSKGPEFDKLTTEQQNTLVGSEFKVSKFNNRMAYQLEPNLENKLDPILTSAVLPGTVQLTPSGQLIVLMRDCQTTGGYPRVLQLTKKAINTLGQKTTGNQLKFRLTR